MSIIVDRLYYIGLDTTVNMRSYNSPNGGVRDQDSNITRSSPGPVAGHLGGFVARCVRPPKGRE